MRKFHAVVLLVIIIGLSACSSFDKMMKSRDYQTMYKMGLQYYEEKKHHRYTVVFEHLIPIYKGTLQADTIEYYLAEGYYHQGDYLVAAHFFDRFRQNYPRSVFTEQAEYMYAHSYYKSSPRPMLDQDPTNSALAAFAEYVVKYPNSPKKAEVNRIMHELRYKLVEKSFINAKLYYEMDDYKAAITALKNNLNYFPDSDFREEQLYLILAASYKLADKSVIEKRRERFQNTLDEYYNLMGEFPETKYKREAERIYANSMSVIEK